MLKNKDLKSAAVWLIENLVIIIILAAPYVALRLVDCKIPWLSLSINENAPWNRQLVACGLDGGMAIALYCALLAMECIGIVIIWDKIES